MNEELETEVTFETVGEPASDVEVDHPQGEAGLNPFMVIGLLLAGALIGFLLRSMKKDTNEEKAARLQSQNETLRKQQSDAAKAKNDAEISLANLKHQNETVAQINADAAEQAKQSAAEKDSSINSLEKQLVARNSDVKTLTDKSEKLTDELAKAHLSNKELADQLDKAMTKESDPDVTKRVLTGFGQWSRFKPYLKKMNATNKKAINKVIEAYNADVAAHLADPDKGKWKGQSTPVSKISPLK